MQSNYRYKFAGPYLDCPRCGKAKKYRDRYDTATGLPVAHLECGACFSCGFDVKVRDYFAEHPEARSQADDWQPLPSPPVTYIDRHHVTDYMTADLAKSNLLAYLLPLLGKEDMMPVVRKYGVGVDADGSTRWPQIDEIKRVRQIKVQQHNRFNGHREGTTVFVHKYLRDRNEVDPESTHARCLFGLHLLANANEQTVAAIVESEKTAIILATLFPDVVWLATGGEQNFGLVADAQNVLRRCGAVIIYPDAGSRKKWVNAAQSLKLNNVEFSDLCSGHPHNTDLADLIIYEYLATHRQPRQQELSFNVKTTHPKPAPHIVYRCTPLFAEPCAYNFEAITDEEFDQILSPSAVAQWQAAHLTAPF